MGSTNVVSGRIPKLLIPLKGLRGTVISQLHASAPKRRVVIIEDDRDFAACLTSLLAGLGHVVLVRLDSSAAETYEIRDTDIVFLDLRMPRVSGIQVLDQLNRQNLQSPIVLMSGNNEDLCVAENSIKKLHLWLLGVLYKPFRLEDVIAVLEGA